MDKMIDLTPRRIREQRAAAPSPIQWAYVFCGDLTVSTAKLEALVAEELTQHNNFRTEDNRLKGLDGFLMYLDRCQHVAETQRDLAREIVTPIWQNWPL